jgi:hypothetical protein
MFELAACLVQKGVPGVDFSTLTFTDWEVLKYEPGSFFDVHVDRVRGKGHVGTLLLVITSDDFELDGEEGGAGGAGGAGEEGGAGGAGGAGEEGGGCKSRSHSCGLLHEDGTPAWTKDPRDPHLVFIPLRVKHQVAKLRAGTRLVGKASVYGDLSTDPAIKRLNAVYIAEGCLSD